MENKAKNTVTFYFSLKVAYRERLYDTKKSQASKRSKSPHLGTFNCTIRAGPALDPPGDAAGRGCTVAAHAGRPRGRHLHARSRRCPGRRKSRLT